MHPKHPCPQHVSKQFLQHFFVLATCFMWAACAQFQHQPPETMPFADRFQTQSDSDVRVTVGVPSAEESLQVFGLPLAAEGIQPVWLEIQNNDSIGYFLLAIHLDPDLFSAGEVAWKFHTGYSDDARQKINQLFREKEIEGYFKPGKTTSGFVYTNAKLGTKPVLVRLLGEDKLKEFMFFVDVPGLKADHASFDPASMYSKDQIVDLDDDGLRLALERMQCCTTNKDGSEFGDPLNIVVIGERDTIWKAFISRGWDETEIIYGESVAKTIGSSLFGKRYRYSPISALYLYGRPQDVALQKARRTVDERNHLRLWFSPMRYRGLPVYVGQISRDIGVKLTTKSPTFTTHAIDSDLDESRDYLIQDLIESQYVAKIGLVKGVGAATPENPRYNLTDDPIWTDGLRVVFVFTEKPTAILDIELFDWEPL
ncbi:MAG: LssY C-terminal domain-containing protein [Desulfobacterales bacterium]|nr:MAG: LssY C-terminal domain-containing protein [Desulfobacterales bacterium]